MESATRQDRAGAGAVLRSWCGRRRQERKNGVSIPSCTGFVYVSVSGAGLFGVGSSAPGVGVASFSDSLVKKNPPRQLQHITTNTQH